MKIFSCIVLLVAIAVVSGFQRHYDIKDAPALFEKFIKNHGRHYKSDADRLEHYTAFVKSLERINEAAAKNNNSILDINEFSDYTPLEMQHLLAYGSAFIYNIT